jgi:hypothetical protein
LVFLQGLKTQNCCCFSIVAITDKINNETQIRTKIFSQMFYSVGVD